MKKLTDEQQREILAAVAGWEPPPVFEELASDLRDEIAATLAPVLGVSAEAAMSRMQGIRMTS